MLPASTLATATPAVYVGSAADHVTLSAVYDPTDDTTWGKVKALYR